MVSTTNYDGADWIDHEQAQMADHASEAIDRINHEGVDTDESSY